jgi:hypothetical protein
VVHSRGGSERGSWKDLERCGQSQGKTDGKATHCGEPLPPND